MAAATIGVTGSSEVNKLWKKIQGDLGEGFNFLVEEFDWLDDYPEVEFPWSQREVTFTVDLDDAVGVAKIPDGGYRARPSRVNTEEATFALTNYNATFTASHLAKWAEQGQTNLIEKELKFSGAKKLQAMARVIGDDMYGYSTATLALTDTNFSGTSTTATIHSAFGDTSITNAAYLADRFRTGQYVAIFESSTLQGIGVVGTITPATPSIALTTTSITNSNNNLIITGAESLENTTSAGTDLNRGLVGFLDVCKSDTVHALSKTTDNTRWDVAYSDTTTGGRIDPTRLQKLDDEIENKAPGGKGPDTYLMTKGIYRDLVDQQRAAQEFSSPIGMEVDGSVKKRGKRFLKTRRVPPGHLIAYDKSKYQKLMLLPKPTNSIRWSDGIDLINQEGSLFVMNAVVGLACRSRASFGYMTGLTES